MSTGKAAFGPVAEDDDAFAALPGSDDMSTPLVPRKAVEVEGEGLEEAVETREPQMAGKSRGEAGERNPEATAWRDWPWGALFWAHVLAIFIVACTVGVDVQQQETVREMYYENGALREKHQAGSKDQSITGGVVLLVFVSAVLAAGYTGVLLHFAEQIITAMSLGGIAFALLLGLILLFSGSAAGGILFLIVGAIHLCFYMRFKDRIPFAAANLKAACTAVMEMPSAIAVALLMLGVSVMWVLVWSFALYGAVSNGTQDEVEIAGIEFELNQCYEVVFTDDWENVAPGCHCANMEVTASMNGSCLHSEINGGIWFVLLISLYWGINTFANVIHVTVAGAVASWWFTPMAPSPVRSSLRRAMTTSFGSIALGSLLVAILQAIRQGLHSMRRNRNIGIAFALCIDCLLNLIENLLRFFNRYAFTYVGIYGHDFTTAGKAVWELFERRGITALANDVLVDRALGMGAFLVGGISCGIGFGYGMGRGLDDGNVLAVTLLGFSIGFALTIIATNVISSAVATIFVCFAEDPTPFEQNHPDLHNTLVSTWRRFYPAEYDSFTASRTQV